MYTDTKNLTQSHIAASGQQIKSRGKMRKVWKPLLRLLSAQTGGPRKCHPNNLDLNNIPCESLKEHTEGFAEDQEVICTESIKLAPLVALDAGAASATAKSTCYQSALLPAKDVAESLISSVYIEKTAASSCNSCIYGRNCQHAHSGHAHDLQQFLMQADHVLCETLNLPLHGGVGDGVGAVPGSPFDELLHVWLCQQMTALQMPGTLC